MQKPASGPSPQQLELYRREKLGPLYGRFFVAPGVRWPSEFSEDGVWQPLPPKKPAESIRLACEGAWLKKAIGAEFEFRAEVNGVTGPSSMAATASAYPNSDARNSEKEVPPLLASDVERLIRRLDIPHYLRRTLPIYWSICTRPYGREIRMWKGVDDFATAAQVCRKTARNHLRHFERLELIEVASDSTGKRLVANTVHRPTTYRLRNETLVRNRWPECKRCGHKHRTAQECGCDMGERRGTFCTKSGKRISKVVRRTCRCKPIFDEAPTPIRPQRSSPPAQEPAAAPSPATVTAPVPVAHRSSALKLGTRQFQKVRELRAQLKARIADNLKGCHGKIPTERGESLWVDEDSPMFRLPMAPENAFIAACLSLQLSEREGRELLQFEDAETSP